VLLFQSPGYSKTFNPFVLLRTFYGPYDETTNIDWTSDSRFGIYNDCHFLVRRVRRMGGRSRCRPPPAHQPAIPCQPTNPPSPASRPLAVPCPAHQPAFPCQSPTCRPVPSPPTRLPLSACPPAVPCPVCQFLGRPTPQFTPPGELRLGQFILHGYHRSLP